MFSLRNKKKISYPQYPILSGTVGYLAQIQSRKQAAM